MVKLKIKKIDSFNKYVLVNLHTNEIHSLYLEFYGINKPNIDDMIAIDEKLLDPKYEGYCQPYAFIACTSKETMPKNNSEYMALKTKTSNYILKRIYG